jgi:xylono-1,5-lactonase
MVALIGQRVELIGLEDSADGPPRLRRLGSLFDVPLVPGQLLNDAVIDPEGRLWVDVVHRSGVPGSGRLLLVSGDGAVTDVVHGLSAPNGLAVSVTGDLLNADSRDRLVRNLGRRASAQGEEALERKVVLRFTEGLPDGLAADSEGGLWVAVYGAGQVHHFTASGALDSIVDVPTPQTTSVALGGLEGHDLLITTGREGYDDRRSAADPTAGMIFMAAAPYPSAPVHLARLRPPVPPSNRGVSEPSSRRPPAP